MPLNNIMHPAVEMLSPLIFPTSVPGCVKSLVFPCAFPNDPWLQFFYKLFIAVSGLTLARLFKFIVRASWIHFVIDRPRGKLPRPSLLDDYSIVFDKSFGGETLDYNAIAASGTSVGELMKRSSMSVTYAESINHAVEAMRENLQKVLELRNLPKLVENRKSVREFLALHSENKRLGKYIMIRLDSMIQLHKIDLNNVAQRQAFYDLQALLDTFFFEPRNNTSTWPTFRNLRNHAPVSSELLLHSYLTICFR
ncbi:hypothetical protein BDP27DRAFT_856416 [Rhodocollybia butyracea]|uniref:Uncharacterized protein n=1 Tax=Rhodocollybia butyracea TaxID=206335 RepID=A0A9P5U6G0_9AGAR|nr:hypothetical protein BDP27DRAFT_856416 [Rhodocollybia butyracea]